MKPLKDAYLKAGDIKDDPKFGSSSERLERCETNSKDFSSRKPFAWFDTIQSVTRNEIKYKFTSLFLFLARLSAISIGTIMEHIL